MAAQTLDEPLEQLATDLMQAVGSDTYSLAPLCALIEIADFVTAPAIAAVPYPTLFHAAERGVLFPGGWSCLIPRALGVAATCNRWWDEAETALQTAIATATAAGAQQELGRSSLDYARMLASRGSMHDRCRALALAQQASAIFAPLGMHPFIQRAAQLTERLQSALPPWLQRRRVDPGALDKEAAAILSSTQNCTTFLR
jgi:hypothetical protein